MYMCVYVCLHNIYICPKIQFVWQFTSVFAYLHAYRTTYVHAYIHADIYTYIQIYIHIDTHVYVHIHAYAHIYTYTRIYTYAHTYIYIHTQNECMQTDTARHLGWDEITAVFCSVLQCVAVYCSVLQCIADCCCVLLWVAVCCSVLQCVAVWYCWHDIGMGSSHIGMRWYYGMRLWDHTMGWYYGINTARHRATGGGHVVQRTATHCNTLQHTATLCNTLQHTATHCTHRTTVGGHVDHNHCQSLQLLGISDRVFVQITDVLRDSDQ